MGEIVKVNKLLTIIPTGNITELNELIYSGAKLVCDTICIRLVNPSKNTKPRWEVRLEGQIQKLLQQAKILRKEKHARIYETI